MTFSITRLYSDKQGHSRFEDVDVVFAPEDPPLGATSVSEQLSAAAVLFARAKAGGGHGEQPEDQRQLAVGISGTAEITASGETRTFGRGDVLLIEDTEGFGHSSRTTDGFVAAIIVLAPPPDRPCTR